MTHDFRPSTLVPGATPEIRILNIGVLMDIPSLTSLASLP